MKKSDYTNPTKQNQTETEYPLKAPYEFEGFTTPDESIKLLAEDLRLETRVDNLGIVIIREGQNDNGLWGYLLTISENKLVHQGYTLEPRTIVGKGPIPIGIYKFNRWMSSTLGKTIRLHNVPGFTDILIHVGNRQDQTKGCILAAKEVDQLKNPSRLVKSRQLTDWLYDSGITGEVEVKSK